jgi:hypothetical protein
MSHPTSFKAQNCDGQKCTREKTLYEWQHQIISVIGEGFVNAPQTSNWMDLLKQYFVWYTTEKRVDYFF